MRRPLCVGSCVLLLAAAPDRAAAQTATQEPASTNEASVVSATRRDTNVVDAPASTSVIDANTLTLTPWFAFGDLLRAAGLNVIQFSARDYVVNSRQAAGLLTDSPLVLLDGQPPHGETTGNFWDLIPVTIDDVARMEVVRGPVSTAWGPDAASGVVHILTRPPRDTPTGSVTFTGGAMSRDEGSRAADGPGGLFGVRMSVERPGTHVSYRLSAAYDAASPYSRPVGIIPRGRHPLDDTLLTGGAPYPGDRAGELGSFENRGTSQPRLDVRVDQQAGEGGRLTYEGGFAASDGIIHTTVGPFRMLPDSTNGRAAVTYRRGQLRIDGSGTWLGLKTEDLRLADGLVIPPLPGVSASALDQLRRQMPGNSFDADFTTHTYGASIGHSVLFGGRHPLTYGGDFQWSHFDFTFAPTATSRGIVGGYAQQEIGGEHVRVAGGGRIDKDSRLDQVLFSARAAVMLKPSPGQAFRVSFDRASRPPSILETDLDRPVFAPAGVCCDLRGLERPARDSAPELLPLVLHPFPLIVETRGNPALTAPSVNNYEIAYTAAFGERTLATVVVYQTDRKNDIVYTSLLPSIEHPLGLPGLDFYTAANPPPGVDPALITFLSRIPLDFGGAIVLPRTVNSYLNFAGTRNRGVEAAVTHTFANRLNVYARYTFQDTPRRLNPEAGQLATPFSVMSVPPAHQAVAGANLITRRFLGGGSVQHVDRAFAADLLTAAYDAFTDAYTKIDGMFGVNWADGRVRTLVNGLNLANVKIQQHPFADIIGRSISSEVRFSF